MSNIQLPAGYEPIDGHKYPTKELQRAAYDDIRVFTEEGSRGSFLYGKKKPQAAFKLAWPLDKVFITQGFGLNPKAYAIYGMKGHDGIDLRTRFIDSPLAHREVTAAAPGICEVRDQGKKGYGLHVRIKHQDGSTTIYGHLSKVYVQSGKAVTTGIILGLTGNTGASTGPHLHFEYRPAGEPSTNGYGGAVDPTPFLPPIK